MYMQMQAFILTFFKFKQDQLITTLFIGVDDYLTVVVCLLKNNICNSINLPLYRLSEFVIFYPEIIFV